MLATERDERKRTTRGPGSCQCGGKKDRNHYFFSSASSLPLCPPPPFAVSSIGSNGMIVLCSHVIDHDQDDVGVGEASGDSGSTRGHGGAWVGVAKDVMESDYVEISEDVIHLWKDTRLKVSATLGSIGAPPLTSSQLNAMVHNSPSSGEHTNITNDDQALAIFQNCVCHAANFHASLIRTISSALVVINIGTGLRLGLGANAPGGGNGRIVARSEKAWVSRQMQKMHINGEQTQSIDTTETGTDAHTNPFEPKLSINRSRAVVHQTIVEEAISLESVLKAVLEAQTSPDNTSPAEWYEFVKDLQYSLQSARTRDATVLTLSQLSSWVARLSRLLSFVLSECLSAKLFQIMSENSTTSVKCKDIIASLTQSTQLANERTVFLASAFQLSPSKEDADHNQTSGFTHHQCETSHQQPSTLSQRRQALQIISNLQSTLEAARVSLWAFEESFSHADNNNTANGSEIDFASEDSEIWWSHLKDLLNRTQISVERFECCFLVSANDEPDATIHKEEKARTEVVFNRRYSEHVSNAPSVGDEVQPKADDLPSDKTLVFSGSGAYESQQSRTATSSVSSQQREVNSSPTSNGMDHFMLLRDLENRIKTMGVAEEHEVVTINTDGDMLKNTPEPLRPREEREKATLKSSNDPHCFLGVSGNLLTELTSAMTKEEGSYTVGDNDK